MDSSRRDSVGAEQPIADQAAKVLKFHLRFSLLNLAKFKHLIQFENGSPIQIEYDRLIAVASFRFFDKDDNNDRFGNNNNKNISNNLAARGCDRAIWLAFKLVCLYLCVKFSYLCVIHMRHDRLVAHLRLAEVPSSANLSDYCDFMFAQASIGNLMESREFKRLIETSDELDRFGSPVRTQIGLNLVGFIYAVLILAVVYFMGYSWIWAVKPKLSMLEFIENRRGERAKFQLQLKHLVASLFTIESVQTSDHGRKVLIYRQRESSIERQLVSHWFYRDLDYLNQTLELVKDRSRILVHKELHKMLVPAHLCGWWHQKLCRSLARWPVMRLFLATPAVATFLTCLTLEIFKLTAIRLDAFKCQVSISSNYQTELSGFRLKTLDSEADLEVYRNFDGSWLALLALMWIEARLIINWRVFVTLCEMVLPYVCTAIMLPVYFVIFTYDFGSKILWLIQIEKQLDGCLRQLIEDGTRLEWNLNSSEQETLKRRNESLKQITLAYLNFELFRREQRAYQRLINFMVLQGTIFEICSLAAHYYLFVFAHGNSASDVTMTLASYIALSSNVVYISCAIRTSKMLRLMKTICRLGAFSVDSSLSMAPIMGLWKSQLLTKSETEDCYAPKLFGVTISFDRVIAFNIYWLVTLWLIRKG